MSAPRQGSLFELPGAPRAAAVPAGPPAIRRRAAAYVTLHATERWHGDPAPDVAGALADALAARLRDQLPSRNLPRLGLLTINDNARRMLSVQRVGRDQFTARVCRHLLPDLSDVVFESIVSCLEVGRFPDMLGEAIRELGTAPSVARGSLDTRSDVADLDGAVARSRALLADHAAVLARVQVGWMGVPSEWWRPRRRSIHLGLARPEAATVRVHRVLDSAAVPPFVFDMVVHHELCHVAAPPLTRAAAARNHEHRVHHSRFRALERRFPRLDEANRWISAELDALLSF